MEIKSEYFRNFKENMEKYEIQPESFEFAGDIQMYEEMMFGFHMYLLV
ncbi:hypothetical protein [Alkalibacter mobilis]|nr:hypothetical protein [Alkalibacter mobilis]MBF7097903.1 hypothetical protein [Alkalibacter mobilis]